MIDREELQEDALRQRKVRLVAVKIARMMQGWPEMTWEDVQGVNRHVGFGKWHAHAQRDANAPDVTSGGMLSTADLRTAWELAREIARQRY